MTEQRIPNGERVGRRRLIKGAGVAAAALAVDTLAAGPASAGVDGDVVLGASNNETATTQIINTTAATDAFRAFSATSGTAVFGSSPTGFGVHGKSGSQSNPGTRGQNTGSGPGVSGDSVDGLGVSGISTNGSGVFGRSTTSTGVFGTSSTSGNGVSGQSESGAGVNGSSFNGSGVFGSSVNSNGVSGFSTNGEGVVGDGPVSGVHGTCGTSSGVGVLAQNVAGGDALKVEGRVKFGTAGTAVVASGTKSVTVTLAGVTASDFVLATVQGSGAFFVRNASAGSGQFTITINKAPTSPATVTVAYFVISAS